MNNTAKSVDVVKDCFGVMEVRKNKTPDYQQSPSGGGGGGTTDGEYHW